jgi:hypothetical protein
MHSPPVLKTALNYGALSGLLSFAFFLILYWSGLNPLGPASWMGVWIPVLMMVLSTRHYRQYENGGFLAYWQGFRTGFFTAASSAFVFGALVWLFVTVIDGEVLELYKQESLQAFELTEGMMKSMVGDSAFEQSIENINNMEIGDLVSADVFNKILGGLLTAFITAAFLKREPVYPDEA